MESKLNLVDEVVMQTYIRDLEGNNVFLWITLFSDRYKLVLVEEI